MDQPLKIWPKEMWPLLLNRFEQPDPICTQAKASLNKSRIGAVLKGAIHKAWTSDAELERFQKMACLDEKRWSLSMHFLLLSNPGRVKDAKNKRIFGGMNSNLRRRSE